LTTSTSDKILPRTVSRLIADRRIRYLAVGGVAAAVSYGTFAGVWLVTDRIPYLVIVVLAGTVAALSTYPLYRIAVFGAAISWVAGFFKFYTVTLWGLAFNFAALPFLVEIVGINVLVSQAIVICVGPLINYQLHRFWTFRPARLTSTPPLTPADLGLSEGAGPRP
jgi:putative flippase GtrA